MAGGMVSHGRGGHANIGADSHAYADGEIVREGSIGDQGDGPFSAGRGGAGNISAVNSPRLPARDGDVVPETATRLDKEQSHHVGRGGAGNESHAHSKKSDQHGFSKDTPGHPHEGLADKLKHLIVKKDSKDSVKS